MKAGFGEVSPYLVCSILAAVSPLAIALALLTSDLLPVGSSIYVYLDAAGKDPVGLHATAASGCLLLVAGYLFDAHKWTSDFGRQAFRFLAAAIGALFMISVLHLTEQAPSLPIICGMSLNVLVVVALRSTVLRHRAVEEFSLAVSLAFGFLSACLFVFWVLWAFTPLLGGLHSPWSPELMAKVNPLTVFVLWCSPFIQAVGYSVVAVFAMLRGKVHIPENPDEPLDENSTMYVKGELKLILIGLGFSLMAAWIAASLAAQDSHLSLTVQRLAVAMITGGALYLVGSVGLERVIKAAKDSESVKICLGICQSCWVKGTFLMVFWPLLPFVLLLEFVHQQVRICTLGSSAMDPTEEGDGPMWLPEESRKFLREVRETHKAQVLSASCWVGVITCTFIMVGRFVTVFLAFVAEYSAVLSMGSILAVLFAVGLLLFLLPPVPGVPVYLAAGIIVTQRSLASGSSFSRGCLIAIGLSFVTKLTATALQQKMIGAPFANSVAIKRMIGVHTPAMKAVRHILGKPGLEMGKVAVLVGGPDWPTSVLTGILGLPLGEMLVGTTPVIILVAPIVLTSAYAQRAALETAEAAKVSTYIANIWGMVSVLLLLLGNTSFVFHMQTVLERHKDDLDTFEKDPQEELVLASVKETEAEEEYILKRTTWRFLPGWLQMLLYFGSFCSSGMLHLLVFPLPWEPFQVFTLRSRMSDLPGRNPLSLINATGWMAFNMCCISLIAAVIFLFYRRSLGHGDGKADEKDERSALLQKNP